MSVISSCLERKLMCDDSASGYVISMKSICVVYAKVRVKLNILCLSDLQYCIYDIRVAVAASITVRQSRKRLLFW